MIMLGGGDALGASPPLRFLSPPPPEKLWCLGNRSPQPKAKKVVAGARGKPKPAVSPAAFAHWLWQTIKSLAGAILIYLVVKTLFVEAFRIPSGSMIPTLLIGDWLFVNKVAYGPAIPFTGKHLPG